MADVVSDRLRVGMVGAGNIARFHAAAFRHAGFDLAAVCATAGSARAASFAEEHGVARVLPDVAALAAAAGDLDCILVAAATAPTVEIVDRLAPLALPMLVEKPVALRPAALAPLLGRDLPVLVAYNRRHYAGAIAARAEVADGPPAFGHVTIPEGIVASAADPLESFFSNSVHGLDLARFVFGDLTMSSVERLHDDDGRLVGFEALLRTGRGDVVHLSGNWGTPANFSLNVARPGRRLELLPFELGRVFEGMDVQEPSAEQPLRTYSPREVSVIGLGDDDRDFKPGFVAQARSFARFCSTGDPGVSANLADAEAALGLAEELVLERR